jgi:hypothetical protein
LRLRGARGARQIALRATEWIEASDLQAPALPEREWFGRRKVRDTALWQALDRLGVLARFVPDGSAPFGFALERHPATRAAMVALGLLGAYAIADALLISEDWAELSAAYLAPHFVVGGAVALIGALAMAFVRKPTRVPAPELIVIALLLGAVAGFASYSALLRVNQLAGGPLQTQAYTRSEACDRLEPMAPGLPRIEVGERSSPYWCHFARDAHIDVRVRRGLFGYWQVDFTPHLEAMRQFFAGPPGRADGAAQKTR